MQRSLLNRLITAAVLIPLVVAAVWFAPTAVIAAGFGAFVVIGAWEWGALMRWPRAARLLFTALVLTVLTALYNAAVLQQLLSLLPGLSVPAWALAVVLLWRVQRTGVIQTPLGGPPGRVLIGLLLLLPPWAALVMLHRYQGGPGLVLALFAVIWAADIGAYFAGRRWGARKLAARLSPGKTWEGVFAGALSAVATAAVAAWWLGLGAGTAAGFVILCAAMVPVSVLGDLTESLFKRQAGVKDSGAWLPGHGGVLDRIDSLTSAAPLFVVGAGLIGIDL